MEAGGVVVHCLCINPEAHFVDVFTKYLLLLFFIGEVFAEDPTTRLVHTLRIIEMFLTEACTDRVLPVRIILLVLAVTDQRQALISILTA